MEGHCKSQRLFSFGDPEAIFIWWPRGNWNYTANNKGKGWGQETAPIVKWRIVDLRDRDTRFDLAKSGIISNCQLFPWKDLDE